MPDKTLLYAVLLLYNFQLVRSLEANISVSNYLEITNMKLYGLFRLTNKHNKMVNFTSNT